MAIPVIDLTTSVLGYKQWQAFSYQPYATNAPAIWTTTALPPGLSLDAPTSYSATGVASTNVVTATGNNFANGSAVYFASLTGGSGLAINTVYYVIGLSGALFKLSASVGGAEIDFTTDISAASISKVGTGAISGTPTTPGVYVIGLTATNQSGSSAPATKVVIGIEPAPYSSAANLGVSVFIDTASGAVTFDLGGQIQPQIKEGDDVLFYIQFKRGDEVVDPAPGATLTALKIALKEFEPEATLVIGDDFTKTGSGSSATYILYLSAVGADLAAALSNYESDSSTEFQAVAEILWEGPNTTGVGPNPMRRTSRLFPIQIVRNINLA